MGNKGLFPVVAVPRAFFGTFFRAERKYFPLRGGSPTIRAVVGASIPTGVFLLQNWLAPQLAEGPSKFLNVIIQKSIAAEINTSSP